MSDQIPRDNWRSGRRRPNGPDDMSDYNDDQPLRRNMTATNRQAHRPNGQGAGRDPRRTIIEPVTFERHRRPPREQSSFDTILTDATHGSNVSRRPSPNANEESSRYWPHGNDVLNHMGGFDSSPHLSMSQYDLPAAGPIYPYSDPIRFEPRDHFPRPPREEVFERQGRTEHYERHGSHDTLDHQQQVARHGSQFAHHQQPHDGHQQQLHLPRPQPQSSTDRQQLYPHSRERQPATHRQRPRPRREPQRDRQHRYRHGEDEESPPSEDDRHRKRRHEDR